MSMAHRVDSRFVPPLQGFDDHSFKSVPQGIFARIFNALRSPITSLRPKKM